jgi:hypothetical protein
MDYSSSIPSGMRLYREANSGNHLLNCFWTSLGQNGTTGPLQVLENMVELVGIEPTTSSLRTMRVSITSSVFGTA